MATTKTARVVAIDRPTTRVTISDGGGGRGYRPPALSEPRELSELRDQLAQQMNASVTQERPS